MLRALGINSNGQAIQAVGASSPSTNVGAVISQAFAGLSPDPAVLAFDQFPTDPREQASLVRFRMKKSVPFDVETLGELLRDGIRVHCHDVLRS